MQTFTILFGFAIVAIAMENYLAEFFFAKTSDAGAKGDREIHSRGVKNGQIYWLRGSTGTEEVIIKDGNETIKKTLKETDEELLAKHSKITIAYINDKCCKPNDKNVMFTSQTDYKVSVTHNEKNYFENWNCSACPKSNIPKMLARMDLQSRTRDKVDTCYKTRENDDCKKCKVVNEGHFCYPGNYTIEFRTEGQCEGVTFGECDIDKRKLLEKSPAANDEECSAQCYLEQDCIWYQFNNGECKLFNEDYLANDCNIRAGPKNKPAGQCLKRDLGKVCDSMVKEECEYDGELVKQLRDGAVVSSSVCQKQCKLRSGCEHWIFNRKEARCILRGKVKTTCNASSGPRLTPEDYDHCEKEFHKD